MLIFYRIKMLFFFGENDRGYGKQGNGVVIEIGCLRFGLRVIYRLVIREGFNR